LHLTIILSNSIIEFTCFDIGGQKKIRALWHHYFEGVDAIIYVVDVGDKKRLDEACSELCDILKHPFLLQAAVVVYANKQDIKNCATSYEVTVSSSLPY